MEELFGAKDWVTQPKPASSKRQRRDVIAKWVLGNHLLTSIPDTHNMPEAEKAKLWSAVYEAADRGIAALRKGELGPVKSINAMLTYVTDKQLSPTVVDGHRLKIFKFYRYIGVPLSESQLEQVNEVDAPTRLTDDKSLTNADIKNGLLKAPRPKSKAMFAFMVNTGARIGETVKVKLSDVEFDKTPVVVRFPARKTKTKTIRYSFLSSECVGIIKDYLKLRTRESEYLFDGHDQEDWKRDMHISTTNAWKMVREIYELIGLVEPNKKKNGNHKGAHEPYHPHIMRGTALAIMKRAGYPDSYAEFLAGHSTGAKEHYYFEDETAPLWQTKCEPAFRFLTDTDEKVKSLEEKMLELEKGIETDRKIVEEQFLTPPSKPKPSNGKQYETRKIDSADEEALERALAEGFEPVPGMVANGHIFLRRKVS